MNCSGSHLARLMSIGVVSFSIGFVGAPAVSAQEPMRISAQPATKQVVRTASPDTAESMARTPSLSRIGDVPYDMPKRAKPATLRATLKPANVAPQTEATTAPKAETRKKSFVRTSPARTNAKPAAQQQPQRVNNAPTRAANMAPTMYDLPFFGNDLASGERYYRGKKIHSSSGSQKWGYDLGAMRKRSGKDLWRETKSSTDWNDTKTP